MPKSDLDRDDSEILPGDDDSRESKSAGSSDTVDYKSKYQGASKAIDRLQRKLREAQEQLEDRNDKAEEELSALRIKVSDLTKLTKEKDDALGTVTSKTTELERSLNRLKAQSDSAAVIAEKYPALLADHLIGDLKNRGDFDNDEAYDKYLVRQAAKAGQTPAPEQQQEAETDQEPPIQQNVRQRMRGSTPSASYRAVDKSGKGRSAEDISDQLMGLDPASPTYDQDARALYAELNEATN
jgi:chromosome segregation ATPase